MLFSLFGCSGDGPGSDGTPGAVPASPLDPAPAITVAQASDVVNGAVLGKVFLFGKLSRQLAGGEDEWIFVDDSEVELRLDFAADHVPAIDQSFFAYGTVESGPELDMIAWEPLEAAPDPIRLPVTPEDPTPPDLVVTKIVTILAGAAPREVILAGELAERTSVVSEWLFADDTGVIVLDFPSNHVPIVGAPVFVLGTIQAGLSIDVAEWQPQ